MDRSAMFSEVTDRRHQPPHILGSVLSLFNIELVAAQLFNMAPLSTNTFGGRDGPLPTR
jgi:hypothetical protein